jgi:protein gp37
LLTRPDFPDRVREAMAKYVELLTPRSGRLSPLRRGWIDGIMAAIADFRWPLPNVVLGVSAGSQESAEKFIPPLLKSPAANRLLSAEPLIAPLDLDGIKRGTVGSLRYWLSGRPHLGPEYTTPTGMILQDIVVGPHLDWVIVGGESGKVYQPDPWHPPTDDKGETGGFARPMDLAWARHLVWECANADVPVFVKQLGTVQAHLMGLADRKGADASEWPRHVADLVVRGSLDPTG